MVRILSLLVAPRLWLHFTAESLKAFEAALLGGSAVMTRVEVGTRTAWLIENQMNTFSKTFCDPRSKGGLAG